MKKVEFTSAVALVTPYKENGKVDYDKLRQLIEFHRKNLTDAILVCGTTGESSTMSDETQISIIQHAVKYADGKVPILAGTGSNDTEHAKKLSRMAQDVGADAVLSVTPYYNKTTQKGLIEHYTAIANEIDIPMILYNVKSRTGMNIEPETVRKLSGIPNICGIKECNINQVAKIRNLCGKDFFIYSGEDAFITPYLSLGARGVISVAANIIPRQISQIVSSFSRYPELSIEMQLKYLDLIEALFIEVNPIPIKAAMNILGMNVGKCKLPLTDMEEKNYNQLKKVIEKYNLKVEMD